MQFQQHQVLLLPLLSLALLSHSLLSPLHTAAQAVQSQGQKCAYVTDCLSAAGHETPTISLYTTPRCSFVSTHHIMCLYNTKGTELSLTAKTR
jgi:hypothetical protein